MISAGIFCFAAAYILFTASTDPWLLIVPRVLYGLGVLSTFGIGVAYIADRTSGPSRDLAIGAYVSAQGIGYAIGPLIAGALASRMSVVTLYRFTAAAAVLTGVYAWRRLEDRRRPATATRPPRESWRQLVRRPALAGVSLGNLVIMLMFNGSIVPFLAVVAVEHHLDKQRVALLYGLRAIASTVARLPAGQLAVRFSNRSLFLASMLVEAGAAAGIGFAPNIPLVVVAAVVDGIAFGTFLGTSQSFIAESVAASGVGGWLGVYSAAGAIGETIGGATMGAIAAGYGGAGVFRVAALVLATGTIISWLALTRAQEAPDGAPEPAA